MTLTFNTEKFQELLSYYQTKIIKTEEENEKALAIIEELMHCKHRTNEENELYDLLIGLVEKFEQDFYLPATSTSTPNSMLLFLMEQQDVSKKDLEEVMGSAKIVSDLVNGKQNISKEQAKILANLFHVDPSLFI